MIDNTKHTPKKADMQIGFNSFTKATVAQD